MHGARCWQVPEVRLSAPGMPSGDVSVNELKKSLFGKIFKKKPSKRGIAVSDTHLLGVALMLPTSSKRNSVLVA